MSSIRRIILATTLIIIIPAAFAMADWIPEDGHKMHFPQLPDEAGWDVFSSPDEMLADDWQCSASGPITDIHFWGSWKGGLEGDITRFILNIYADIPADPPEIPYSRPGEPLWSFEVPIGEVMVLPVESQTLQGWYHPNNDEWLLDDHTEYFQYNVFLPEGFYFFQDQGTIYWLSVAPVLADPVNTFWGWKSSLTQWNDDAVYRDLDSQDWIELHSPPFDGFYDYVPGDVNGDGVVNMGDVAFYNCWQMGICPPPPEYDGFYASLDANGDCQANVGDVTYLISYLEHGGPEPWCCDMYPTMGCAPSLDLAFVVNGQADICDCIPGDANGDGSVNVGDAVYIISYIFKGGPPPTPYLLCSGDANCDCEVNVGDAVYNITYAFLFGPPPCSCEDWLDICGEPLRK